DAAIAAWELKRKYLSSRPITLIRYMAEHGQRTDPEGPAYDPQGLPLIDGLIEVITPESAAPGERHEKLSRYVGEIAVRGWRGEPGDRTQDDGGVGWELGVEWIPYQRRTFVTPAFPGYISGHSTFSRAAAEVLARLTGSEYFPGGLGSYSFKPGYLFFEYGPSAPLSLQWASYYDAADQAGQSRLWGGIHISFDDFEGRRAGASIGKTALLKAQGFFGPISTQ
ncbi:MAG: vanadium-dependent haloperoxidase, partial [Pseudomonadota bacterium]